MIAYVREMMKRGLLHFYRRHDLLGNGGANILVNRHGLYMLVRDEFAINLRLIVTQRSNCEEASICSSLHSQIRLLPFIEFCNFDIDLLPYVPRIAFCMNRNSQFV